MKISGLYFGVCALLLALGLNNHAQAFEIAATEAWSFEYAEGQVFNAVSGESFDFPENTSLSIDSFDALNSPGAEHFSRRTVEEMGQENNGGFVIRLHVHFD